MTRTHERRAVLRAAAVAVNALDEAIREFEVGSPKVEAASEAANTAVAKAKALGFTTADVGRARRSVEAGVA